MSIKFAPPERIPQKVEGSSLLARNERLSGVKRAGTLGRESGSYFRGFVETMTLVETLVRALDTTFILMVMQDERHYIGERRQAFVPMDDPELIDHVTNVILSEGAKIRSAVESVFIEVSQTR